MKAATFGCFWFGIKGGRPASWEEDFDPKEHLEKTKQALSRIANITEVSVELDENLFLGSGNPVDLPDKFPDYSFFPSYVFVTIRFGIYIPRRLQNELTLVSEDWPVETENFSVVITYDFLMPFTIIFYETKDRFPNSSRAVVVIRKYLEREFKDDLVTFCSIGPSPFHADLMLVKNEVAEISNFVIRDISDNQRGYSQLEAKYPSKISGDGALIDALARYIGPFLSAYYAFARDRVNLIYLKDIANEHLERLLEIERTRGIWRLWNHLFRASNIINDILVAMLRIEIEKARANKFFVEQKREQQLLEETPLHLFIVRIREGQQIFPAAEI